MMTNPERPNAHQMGDAFSKIWSGKYQCKLYPKNLPDFVSEIWPYTMVLGSSAN